jgi:hydrogenase small subunit
MVPDRPTFTVIWLSGTNCDGCSIRALGDVTAGGLGTVLTGGVDGLPPVRLLHTLLSPESGDAFLDQLRRAGQGELDPYGLINEGAVPTEPATGFYSGLGDAGGRPTGLADWLDLLAPRARFVLAWGDCAVWGGPHSLRPNPTGSTGTEMHLGTGFRSAGGLPVINAPGCAAPAVLVGLLIELLRWDSGEGPAPRLDRDNRPASYSEPWDGAFVAWED